MNIAFRRLIFLFALVLIACIWKNNKFYYISCESSFFSCCLSKLLNTSRMSHVIHDCVSSIAKSTHGNYEITTKYIEGVLLIRFSARFMIWSKTHIVSIGTTPTVRRYRCRLRAVITPKSYN